MQDASPEASDRKSSRQVRCSVANRFLHSHLWYLSRCQSFEHPAIVCHNIYIMMYRTQITLDPELQRRARKKAQAQGISFSEYLRRLLARDLGKPSAGASPSVIFDLGDSGESNVARNKDLMIGEAVAAHGTHFKK